MAEPIAEDQNNDAANGRKTEIERSQREKDPSAPQAKNVTCCKTDHTESQIQEQSPYTSAAYQMIERAIGQCDQEAKENRWERHHRYYR